MLSEQMRVLDSHLIDHAWIGGGGVPESDGLELGIRCHTLIVEQQSQGLERDGVLCFEDSDTLRSGSRRLHLVVEVEDGMSRCGDGEKVMRKGRKI